MKLPSMRYVWMVMATFLFYHDVAVAMLNEDIFRQARVEAEQEQTKAHAEVFKFMRDLDHHRNRRGHVHDKGAVVREAEQIRRLVEEHRNRHKRDTGQQLKTSEEIAEIRELFHLYKDHDSVKLAGINQKAPIVRTSNSEPVVMASPDERALKKKPILRPGNRHDMRPWPVIHSHAPRDTQSNDERGLAGNADDKSTLLRALIGGEREAKAAKRTTPDANGCHAWQTFDGTHCVCADTDECPAEGGYVCDDLGNMYNSLCSFQFSVCHQDISMMRTVGVCHDCEYIRLQGGSIFTEDPEYGLGIFRRMVLPHEYLNETVEYHAVDSSGYAVWIVEEWEEWVVGKRNSSGEYIMAKAFVAGGLTDPLEISKGGFEVLVENEGELAWEIDPYLHFECISEDDISRKRLFFTALVIIAVVATVTATTLAVVQSEKGCLYFPEVCDLREELEDVLIPRVEGKQDTFERNYGDAQVFKDNAFTSYEYTADVRAGLISIQTLFDEFGTYSTNALSLLGDIPRMEFTDNFGYSLEAYEQYEEGLGKAAALSVLALEIEIALAVYSLSSTVVSTSALAFAALGAVVAIFAAVLSIIQSIEQERGIRDTLRQNKADILDAEQKLNSATAGMIAFQKEICVELIVPLSKLALAGAAFSLDFWWFIFFFIFSGVFVTEEALCNNANRFSWITGSFMESLPDWLNYIKAHVENDVAILQAAVEQARQLEAFANYLRSDVIDNARRPSEILSFSQENKPADIVGQLFLNEYELLDYIAGTIIPGRSCYWGVSLGPFRNGAATSGNYQDPAVVVPCASAEISTQTSLITNDLNSEFPPCRIINRVDPTIFRSVSALMRFIAIEIRSSERCYWGFDLAAIRSGSLSNAQLNAASLTPNSFLVAGLAPLTSAGFVQASGTFCTVDNVCSNDAWVGFLLCVVNPAWSGVSEVATCSGVPNQAACHVTWNTFSGC